MSPLYADRFAGHYFTGDPRTPVQGAGGCVWPTVPPYRVQFSSTTATGQWEFLRYTPVIFQQVESPFHHNLLTYEMIEQPGPVYAWTLYKTHTRSLFPEWEWQMCIMLIGWPDEVCFAKSKTGKCNVDVVWGNLSIPYGAGLTGATFTQFQVVYDKLRHPGWVPPP